VSIRALSGSFGRRGAARSLGAARADAPPAPAPLAWCYPGVALPCLCAPSTLFTPSEERPPGCTEAPYCDDPGVEPPCQSSRAEKLRDNVRTFAPLVLGGAVVGAGVGYAWKRDRHGALVGAGVGGVGAPIGLAVLAAFALAHMNG
jgi:hypothetical protein